MRPSSGSRRHTRTAGKRRALAAVAVAAAFGFLTTGAGCPPPGQPCQPYPPSSAVC
ncbi:hypothetical protein; putative signal peptide [Frankia alni ACN14a]|uniref:Uncharacterized protein n=1 Tax=Frankia alni (strain DSM 45986 / CECT 9034 / ACN14a) TaxID=326424 RepID=Q0RPP7_FRAAA|nr:hypothetical protein; putative signal peptide [Frankia alni ACN14a]